MHSVADNWEQLSGVFSEVPPCAAIVGISAKRPPRFMFCTMNSEDCQGLCEYHSKLLRYNRQCPVTTNQSLTMQYRLEHAKANYVKYHARELTWVVDPEMPPTSWFVRMWVDSGPRVGITITFGSHTTVWVAAKGVAAFEMPLYALVFVCDAVVYSMTKRGLVPAYASEEGQAMSLWAHAHRHCETSARHFLDSFRKVISWWKHDAAKAREPEQLRAAAETWIEEALPSDDPVMQWVDSFSATLT